MPTSLPLTTSAPTISSREIADLVESRHDKVKQSIERLAIRGVIALPPMGEYLDSLGRSAEEYRIGKRDSYVVVAQLSPEFTARLVDRWQELETSTAAPQIPTTAEAFANAFLMIADSERRQAEQDRALQAIGAKVERIEQAQTVMSSCPANAEPITHLRVRISKMFGISADTIDAVMRQSPYAPRPAGTVRNGHEDALQSTYAVYWKKDVTAVFERFASECSRVTPTMCTHPFVEGRFKFDAFRSPQPSTLN